MTNKNTREISPDEAARGVSAVGSFINKAVHSVSNAYQFGTKALDGLAASPLVNSALGRGSTLAYEAKAWAGALNVFKGVDEAEVIRLMGRDNKNDEGKPKPLIKRLGDTANYISKHTSADSIIAGSLIAGKHAAAIKLGALVGAGVALAGGSPAMVATAGIIAGGAIYKGAKILLSTDAGHALEHGMGNVLRGGHNLFKKLVRADKGMDPEYNHVAKIGHAMEAAHSHDHGHHHKHESVWKTLGNDIGKVAKFAWNIVTIKNAGSAMKKIYDIANDSAKELVVSIMEPTANAKQKMHMQNSVDMGVKISPDMPKPKTQIDMKMV